MLELQKEMVVSQLAMQEMLLDIAAVTGVEPTDLPRQSRKGSLKTMIASAYEEGPSYRRQGSVDTDPGVKSYRRQISR